MNKFLFVLLFVISYHSNAQTNAVLTRKAAVYEVYDPDGYSNLRKGKNSSSAVLEKVNSGEKIEILDKTNDWWYVRTKNGKTGYIHSSRIITKDKETIKPAAAKTDKSLKLATFNTVSAKFNFIISATKIVKPENKASAVNIMIVDKKNPAKQQSVSFKPNFWFSNELTATSYLNKTRTSEGIEEYHKFIVADYNFDGLEDFAIVTSEGGNGGPQFTYFLQNKQGDFIKDGKFPLQDGYFPEKIEPKTKTLTISGPVGCCSISTAIYQLKAMNKWTMISSKNEKM